MEGLRARLNDLASRAKLGTTKSLVEEAAKAQTESQMHERLRKLICEAMDDHQIETMVEASGILLSLLDRQRSLGI